jgi:hypothetical protein
VEIGFNDDVQYRGAMFHLQTEDHGVSDGRVSTQLYLSGRVVGSTEVSYLSVIDGIVGEEERCAKIRKVMVASHRRLYEKLLNGVLDDEAGFEPWDEGVVDASAADSAEPSPSGSDELDADRQEIPPDVVAPEAHPPPSPKRRAFLGFVAPPPDVDIVALVIDHLNSN